MEPASSQIRWTPRWRAIRVALAVGLICSAGAPVLFGGVGLAFLILACVVPAALLGAAGVVAVVISTCFKDPSTREFGASASRAALLGASLLPGLVVVFFGSLMIDQMRVESAMQWCDGLKPNLEAWRALHGAYPQQLSELGIELDPPSYCQDGGLLYRATETGYVLDFADDGWLSGYAYSSEDHNWSHYN